MCVYFLPIRSVCVGVRGSSSRLARSDWSKGRAFSIWNEPDDLLDELIDPIGQHPRCQLTEFFLFCSTHCGKEAFFCFIFLIIRVMMKK